MEAYNKGQLEEWRWRYTLASQGKLPCDPFTETLRTEINPKDGSSAGTSETFFTQTFNTGVTKSNGEVSYEEIKEFEGTSYETLILKINELSEELSVKIDRMNMKQTYYKLKYGNVIKNNNMLIENIEKYFKVIDVFDRLNNDLTKSTEELESMLKVLDSFKDELNNNLEQIVLKDLKNKQKKKHLEILMKMKVLEGKIFSVKLNTYYN
ncbi:hypothetical protein ABK040_003620 [Willaertia magna]